MSNDVRFDGRVVIVTGAGGGMGRSHARVLASRGARVVVNDIRGATNVVSEIEDAGGQAVVAEQDVSSVDGAGAIVRRALDAFGRIDALVNNAGIPCRRSFVDLTPDEFDRTQKVNLYGPFFLTHAAWPHLAASGSGRVVMVASKSVVIGATHQAAYAASKGAVLAMARQLAAEGSALGIRVNAVLPSAVTPMRQSTRTHFAERIGTDTTDQALAYLAEQLGIDPTDQALADRSCAVTSAVVAWLCHVDCTANGEFLNAIAGEASRFAFAKSSGITDPSLTVEKVRDEFHTIMDMHAASFPPAVWDGNHG